VLWGSGSCRDVIFRSAAREEQKSRHPSPMRDSSSLLLVGPRIAFAAVSYLSKPYHAPGETLQSMERRAVPADCKGGGQEGKETFILGQHCLIRGLNVSCSVTHLAAQQSLTAGNC